MAEPVLVVHGVATHDPQGFYSNVEKIGAELGNQWQLVPVFWGDLGGKGDTIIDVLPPVDGTSVRGDALSVDPILVGTLLSSSGSGPTVRSTDERADTIARGVAAAKGGADNEIIRGEIEIQAIQETVRQTLPHTRFLKEVGDTDVLEAVGRILGASIETNAPTPAVGEIVRGPYNLGGPAGPYTDTGDAETRGIVERIRNVSARVLHEIDTLLGEAIGHTLGRVNQNLRAALAEPFAGFFGDIFAYQRNRSRIHARLWEAIEHHAPGYGTKDQPIHVIAHSLGGVVSFDAAIMGTLNGQVMPQSERAEVRPLWINGFVTFGSQAAFFHVLDRREELGVYSRGLPVTLPPTIQQWTNLWDPLDFLAFTAGTVFRLHNGQPPRDIATSNPSSLLVGEKGWTHSIYWKTEELLQAVRDTLV